MKVIPLFNEMSTSIRSSGKMIVLLGVTQIRWKGLNEIGVITKNRRIMYYDVTESTILSLKLVLVILKIILSTITVVRERKKQYQKTKTKITKKVHTTKINFDSFLIW